MTTQPPEKTPGEVTEKGANRFREALAAFESRNFRILFTGRLTSNMARSMRVFLRSWLTLELTNSPFLMGVVASSLSWPMLVVPFIGGVLADRVNRKTLLLWTEGLLTVLWAFTAMCVMFGAWEIGPTPLRIQWWHFTITSFLSGVIQSIGRPGHQAMVGSVVDRKRLAGAVALDSVSDTWPRVGGPAIAAVAIAALGGDWHTWGPWLFGLTSLGQGLTFITILMLKWEPNMEVAKKRTKDNEQPIWKDFTEGIKILKGHQVLGALVLLGLSFHLLAGGAQFLLPVFARDVLGGGGENGAVIQGVLNTSSTIGNSIGALVIVFLATFRNRGLLLLGVALLHSVSVIVFSQSTILALSVGLTMVNTMTSMFFRTTQRVLMQMSAPDDMRGRVMSLDVVQNGLNPIGVLIWGSIAQVLQGKYGLAEGTQMTWLIGGIMYGIIAIVFFAFVPNLRKFKWDTETQGQVEVVPVGRGRRGGRE